MGEYVESESEEEEVDWIKVEEEQVDWIIEKSELIPNSESEPTKSSLRCNLIEPKSEPQFELTYHPESIEELFTKMDIEKVK